MFSKDDAKQANDELDLELEADKGVHQRFAAQLRAFEENPDLSFLRPRLEDQSLLVEKQENVGNPPVLKKWVAFRSHIDLSGQSSLNSTSVDDAVEEAKALTVSPTNSLARDIIHEITKNTELLLILSQKQRDIQVSLLLAIERAETGQEDEDDDNDNDRDPEDYMRVYAEQLNSLVVPIQTLAVTLGGLKNSLKSVQSNNIDRQFFPTQEQVVESNNNNFKGVKKN